jgi:hypothetical protein
MMIDRGVGGHGSVNTEEPDAREIGFVGREHHECRMWEKKRRTYSGIYGLKPGYSGTTGYIGAHRGRQM